jgi:hypothetical protein
MHRPAENRQLALARANGYLDARRRTADSFASAYGFWCWRLRVPLIRMERKSPRSKYGRVCLELFTTGHSLTEQGQAEMADLIRRLHLTGRVAVSAEDGVWEDIPLRRLEELARTILRVATRVGNYELRRAGGEAERQGKVLPWRISA